VVTDVIGMVILLAVSSRQWLVVRRRYARAVG